MSVLTKPATTIHYFIATTYINLVVITSVITN